MNIFVLNTKPELAAKDHPKSYLVKIPLETAQMLCTAHHVAGIKHTDIPYKLTHEKHPCSIWVRESRQNYLWAVQYGLSLCEWFTKTRKKTHGCESVLHWARHNIDNVVFGTNRQTPFVLAMPEEYRQQDPVEAYRNYFLGEKRKLAVWEQGQPDWWK